MFFADCSAARTQSPARPPITGIPNSSMSKKLGLIQSRGIGDIIIGLPIAKYYHDRGV